MIRVLVVEDSPTIRALFVNILDQRTEIEVVGEALNGRQAVEMASRLKPNLITMDVVMPDMDGIEATRQIMSIASTPILIVTAHADSPEMNVVFEAMQAGALDVIQKPDVSDKAQYDDWVNTFIEKIKLLSKINLKN